MRKNNKINLLIFSPLENAYSETFIHNHILYLPFNITVVNGVDIYSLKCDGMPINPGNFTKRLWLFIHKNILRKNSLTFFERKLTQFLFKIKPDVVLFEYGHIGALFYKYCYDSKIPFIVHFHGNDASHRPTLEKFFESYNDMFQKAFGIVAVSRSMVARLNSMGAPIDKIIYNPYGVKLDLFKPSMNKIEEITFLAVGRFVEKKAPHLTILAFYEFSRSYPKSKLIFIGDGELQVSCRQIVKALSLADNVIFLGVKKPQEVSEYLQRSYAFIQHSVIGEDGSAEGTPNSIIEAGASGIPVISTRHEGILDVVENGVNGYLVNEYDILGMADAMKRIVSNRSIRQVMSKNARAIVEKNFNLVNHIELLEDVIIQAAKPKNHFE